MCKYSKINIKITISSILPVNNQSKYDLMTFVIISIDIITPYFRYNDSLKENYKAIKYSSM